MWHQSTLSSIVAFGITVRDWPCRSSRGPGILLWGPSLAVLVCYPRWDWDIYLASALARQVWSMPYAKNGASALDSTISHVVSWSCLVLCLGSRILRILWNFLVMLNQYSLMFCTQPEGHQLFQLLIMFGKNEHWYDCDFSWGINN